MNQHFINGFKDCIIKFASRQKRDGKGLNSFFKSKPSLKQKSKLNKNNKAKKTKSQKEEKSGNLNRVVGKLFRKLVRK